MHLMCVMIQRQTAFFSSHWGESEFDAGCVLNSWARTNIHPSLEEVDELKGTLRRAH